MNYKVGQVLYICDENKMKIIPVQVIEEITRTTLETGKVTTYIVMFPDKKKTKANIENLSGIIFDDIDKVEKIMINNATEAIKKMKIAAATLSSEVFDGNEKINAISQIDKPVQVDNNNDIIMVELGNGVKAKMSTKNLKESMEQK